MSNSNLSDLKDACRRIMLDHEAYVVAAELLRRIEIEESPKPYVTITNDKADRYTRKRKR